MRLLIFLFVLLVIDFGLANNRALFCVLDAHDTSVKNFTLSKATVLMRNGSNVLLPLTSSGNRHMLPKHNIYDFYDF